MLFSRVRGVVTYLVVIAVLTTQVVPAPFAWAPWSVQEAHADKTIVIPENVRIEVFEYFRNPYTYDLAAARDVVKPQMELNLKEAEKIVAQLREEWNAKAVKDGVEIMTRRDGTGTEAEVQKMLRDRGFHGEPRKTLWASVQERVNANPKVKFTFEQIIERGVAELGKGTKKSAILKILQNLAPKADPYEFFSLSMAQYLTQRGKDLTNVGRSINEVAQALFQIAEQVEGKGNVDRGAVEALVRTFAKDAPRASKPLSWLGSPEESLRGQLEQKGARFGSQSGEALNIWPDWLVNPLREKLLGMGRSAQGAWNSVRGDWRNAFSWLTGLRYVTTYDTSNLPPEFTKSSGTSPAPTPSGSGNVIISGEAPVATPNSRVVQANTLMLDHAFSSSQRKPGQFHILIDNGTGEILQVWDRDPWSSGAKRLAGPSNTGIRSGGVRGVNIGMSKAYTTYSGNQWAPNLYFTGEGGRTGPLSSHARSTLDTSLNALNEVSDRRLAVYSQAGGGSLKANRLAEIDKALQGDEYMDAKEWKKLVDEKARLRSDLGMPPEEVAPSQPRKMEWLSEVEKAELVAKESPQGTPMAPKGTPDVATPSFWQKWSQKGGIKEQIFYKGAGSKFVEGAKGGLVFVMVQHMVEDTVGKGRNALTAYANLGTPEFAATLGVSAAVGGAMLWGVGATKGGMALLAGGLLGTVMVVGTVVTVDQIMKTANETKRKHDEMILSNQGLLDDVLQEFIQKNKHKVDSQRDDVKNFTTLYLNMWDRKAPRVPEIVGNNSETRAAFLRHVLDENLSLANLRHSEIFTSEVQQDRLIALIAKERMLAMRDMRPVLEHLLFDTDPFIWLRTWSRQVVKVGPDGEEVRRNSNTLVKALLASLEQQKPHNLAALVKENPAEAALVGAVLKKEVEDTKDNPAERKDLARAFVRSLAEGSAQEKLFVEIIDTPYSSYIDGALNSKTHNTALYLWDLMNRMADFLLQGKNWQEVLAEVPVIRILPSGVQALRDLVPTEATQPGVACDEATFSKLMTMNSGARGKWAEEWIRNDPEKYGPLLACLTKPGYVERLSSPEEGAPEEFEF